MSRDLNQLHPTVKRQAEQLIQLAKDTLNLKVIITQTTRTEAEQAALYSQGRGPLAVVNSNRKAAGLASITEQENNHIVTKAATAKNSMHFYGLAFDIAITDPKGKKIIWDESSDWNFDQLDDWTQVGKLGISIGLEWGGNWSTMLDPPHFQNRFGFTLVDLKAGVKPEWI